MKFPSRLKQANSRLASAQVRVKICGFGRKLYLLATLPPRPGSRRQNPHQQYIALGIQANTDGLKLAELEARKVSALLDCKEFSWEPYCKVKKSTVTIQTWIERMQQRYFEVRAKTPKSLQTWKDEYWRIYSKLPLDEEISIDCLEKVLLQTKPDTRSRRRYAISLAALAKFAGLPDKTLKDLKGSYSPRSLPLRNLPSDRQIADAFNSLSNHPEWQWVFGAIAVWGLRPHEAFHLDLTKFPVAYVIEGKTGPRHVRPIYIQWATHWGLETVKLPACNGSNVDLGNRVSHAFKRYKIPFKPYDLRHCWAIRSLKIGYDISLAARELGHSVEVHSSIYHAALSEEVHDQAFKKLLDNPHLPPPPL